MLSGGVMASAAAASPLPEPIRRRLSELSQTVFLREGRRGAQAGQRKPPADDNLVSNLGLQIILYFNLWYFPFWWSCTVIMLHLKFWQLMGYFQMVQIAILVIVSLVELIRMYLGYMGNLQEKVPELAGFWLLTCLIQVPAVLYLCLYEKLLVLPVEKALNSIYLALFLGELMTGFLALREMASQLQSRFHLRQFDHLEERAHPGPQLPV
ncbi:transmembrane protein 17-like [Callorhinchus milii]|nr:transmembrane protein 17-like [Callorhinchus milii]